MATLTEDEIAPSAIAAERERLQEATQHVAQLERRLDALQRELEAARTQREQLLLSVQWRELMAAVNADEEVYAVAERMMDAFAAFRESLVEPENYLREQREEALNEDDIVPYSDTDDYADFSGVETVVEELLAAVKEQLESHAAAPPSSFRQSKHSSLGGSFASDEKPNHPAGESAEAHKVNADARRQALLKLLVITVLMGRVEQYCRFKSISDASNVPQSDAEEMRDGVASVWQWLFHEQPGVLTAEEGAEWKHIAGSFLGDSYTVAP
ncbi:hypothetical protein conserved [Leishmania donovani]|uniref:Uncharacterized protein n=3 Tax=Leishmania donovani species complex TaxID=38574 RepID=A4I4K6_LEIIN|nr:conserved hypothetical protein [Leishmania infantum JPCM5]TPP50729.1 hypothetical protein CGC20_25210 [Leishmania donovani]CAC9509149.1 hypothetical_protein_-_conserved [Leishmania infantum]CAJ1990652.1 hypothetical protein conserved [Leishmania donovani]CAM69718.1 conserved hypothetical protein [Leishmania infantum JPCM5]SUZ43683.1 hypothetical_protein_-_conserved [Leishmania infantum]|eukprot:XP_001466675.1 conserved hypothetical protein [Leishmania infantum JPCM5]